MAQLGMRRREPSTVGTILFVLWGPLVWGLQFTAVYVGHTWICATGMGASASDVLVATATAIAVALIAPVIVMPERVGRLARLDAGEPNAAYLAAIARLLAMLSLFAALWVGAVAFFIQACALAR